VGTASRGIWFVRNTHDLESALHDLDAGDAFAGEVLVQQLFAGTTEKAQSVFCRGRLVGFHAYRQVAAGLGGGEAIKQSVRRPAVCSLVEKIGRQLDWHGALSVDYILADDDATPYLIDCNPRLVEPMSAFRAGADLVGLLLRVSPGGTPDVLPESREGVRTHLAMQALLGCGSRGGTRRDILKECWRLLAASGPYTGSTEELTPVRLDWISAVPLAMTAMLLLASPKLAIKLARGGFGAHLLDLGSIRLIERDDFPRRENPRK
jgi:hypothetical protein